VPRSSTDLSRRSLGRWGEDRAAAHLRSIGLTIVDRNWRPADRSTVGELDLVARAGSLVVFCEVKARRNGGHGGAAAAVDERKQARIRALAEAWLRERGGDLHELDDWTARFDVIAIDGVALHHFASAF
jgi:putative endonuclease